ncbi:putative alcohol dehydrogenase [Lophiostoma macrostomum CBS 122681]|uniref:Putative alcohol dehydrogenase n=1 Tax=Lophiostoma macrostomum CBS 122681 TaxID=1314788 RepID=A0A6A6TS47_9PLEO|nr:putative alcohol dehydrogenase [Lophiostoma macrostomum CBS 122681]
MSTHKALVVTAIGKSLEPAIRPTLTPSAKQLQLRVTVAALNPHDQKARDLGLFIKDSLPAILANDVVGVVTAIGPEVTRFQVGDRVFTQGGMTPNHSGAGLQEYSLAEEDHTSKIPDGFTDDDVATLPTNILPALIGIFDEGRGLGIPWPYLDQAAPFDYAETQLLIIGGGSNCGRYATQLAKLAGFGTIVVVGGNEEQLKGFGATHVVDRHGGHDAVLKRIRDIVGDDLLYAYEAVQGPSQQHLDINALSNTKKGKLARIVFSGGPLDTSKILPKQAGYELKDTFGVSPLYPYLTVPFWKKLGEYLTEGKVKTLSYEVVGGLDAAKVSAVLDEYRDGKRATQPHVHVSS